MINTVELRSLEGAEIGTVTITVTRGFKIRIAVATALMRLAGWVLGGKLNVKGEAAP